ncbi:hypothetical protein JCM19000A_21970 [Silvimonas sp. JCM 19000]
MARYLIPALLCAALAGTACTQDKANAVLATAQSFAATAQQALDAYAQLFAQYNAPAPTTADAQFKLLYSAVASRGMQAAQFADAVGTLGQLQPAAAQQHIQQRFDQLGASYRLLAQTYQNLPQAAWAGASAVACGRQAVAHLTGQLADFASDLNAHPLYPLQLHLQFSQFKAAAVAGQQAQARTQFDQLAQGIAQYEQQHLAALKLTVAAVEQGRQLDQLLARYDTLTLGDAIAGLQRGMALTAGLHSASAASTSARFEQVQADIAADPAWQRAAATPLIAGSACKENKT